MASSITGSLTTKGNKYYMVINLPNEDGKSKPKWKTTGLSVDVKGNEKKASKLLTRTIIEYENGNMQYSKSVTWLEWVKKYLEMKKRDLEPTTYESYCLTYNAHLVPYFQNRGFALTDINPTNLQNYYDSKLAKGKRDGKRGLSSNTVRKHHAVIQGALAEALKKNLITYNPADRVTLPKKVKYSATPYTSVQARELLTKATGDPLFLIICLVLYLGLRRSEVLGLKWSAIDFENSQLEIMDTVVKVITTHKKGTPKNASSNRKLPIDKYLLEALKNAKLEQEKNRLEFGDAYIESDYVCVLADGSEFRPDFVSSHFKLLLKNLGMPHIRFHDLRHTTASLLIEAGWSMLDIKELLGHVSISSIADTYGHIFVKAKREMAKEMENILCVNAEAG